MNLNDLKSWKELTSEQKKQIIEAPAFKYTPLRELQKLEYMVKDNGDINVIDKNALIDIFSVEKKEDQ